jgi:hypothetical protein
MLPLARRKFSMDVAPSDRQLWAIGMVCVQWGLIESLVKVFAHALTDHDNPNDPDRIRFDATRPMTMRLDRWGDLVRERMQPEWAARLLPLIAETRQLQDLRDKIVHGAWSDKENSASPPTGEAHGPFSWGKPGKPFSWQLTYHDIIGVALRMDGLQRDLYQLAIDASRVAGTGKDFTTIGGALRGVSATRSP